MTFPAVGARLEGSLTTAGTTVTPTFTQNTGDRVIIKISLNTDAAQALSSVGDSFTDLTATNNNFHIIYKDLDGSEGGDVAVSLGAAARAAWVSYNITAGTFDPTKPPELSTLVALAGGAGGNAPNSGDLAPSWGALDTLWFTSFHQDGEELDDDTWVTGTPSGFTNLLQKSCGTAGGSSSNCQMASMEQELNASSLNPDAFATAQDRGNECYTLAIAPAAAGGGDTNGRLFGGDLLHSQLFGRLAA